MKRHDPRSPASAVRKIAQQCGHESMAAAVGKSVSLVTKWADDDTDANPHLYACIKLDALFMAATGREPPIFRSYREALKNAATGDHPAGSITRAAMEASVALGNLTHAVLEARCPDGQDGSGCSPEEGHTIHMCTEALREVLRLIDSSVDEEVTP